MSLKGIIGIGISVLLLSGCQDPFYENSSDVMPASASTGYPVVASKHADHQKTMDAPAKKPTATTSSSTASTAAEAPAPSSTTPMIPDSTPMI